MAHFKDMMKKLTKRPDRHGRRDRKNHGSFPGGHFYSPLPDIDEVVARAKSIFDPCVDLGPSIDIRRDAQERLLSDLAGYYPQFPWLNEAAPSCRFHFDQRMFGYGDALILYSILRHMKPKRVIEVGSGFSSALILDVNDLFFDHSMELTFIEPYPDRLNTLLRTEDCKNVTLIDDIVQNTPVTLFEELDAGDVLFIDSSHVSKVGSDVNYLVFQVLPALKSGVVIHFHDIVWPFEYPMQWIIGGKAWTEAYLLRAFLQYNRHFEILLFNSYISLIFKSFVEERMPLFAKNPGGSLWLHKIKS